MNAGRAWVQRNLGYDPRNNPIPQEAFATRAAARATRSVEDIQREIIDFDSQRPEGLSFLAFTTATGLSRFQEIPWPTGKAPKTDKSARKGLAGRLRNVSDPQIKAEGTLQDQAHLAAQIYKGFGRWSTICSAIVCWALIAAE